MRKLLIAVVAVGALVATVFAYSASATPTPMKYVALGDSVAAGAGLPVGGGHNDALCGRSDQAYPHYVAAHLGTEVSNFACTGAKVDEGLYRGQVRENTQLFPQLDKAFHNGTPDVITMTVGANDARWTDFIRSCYTWDCGSKFESYTGKVLRADLRAELYYALYKIKRAGGDTPPQVLLSGYFMPLSDDASCVAADRITTAEVAWLRSEHAALNEAIQDTAEYFDFATYVPVDFTGHELCSDDPWVQDLTDVAPFHPNADGQAAIGRAFVNAL